MDLYSAGDPRITKEKLNAKKYAKSVLESISRIAVKKRQHVSEASDVSLTTACFPASNISFNLSEISRRTDNDSIFDDSIESKLPNLELFGVKAGGANRYKPTTVTIEHQDGVFS